MVRGFLYQKFDFSYLEISMLLNDGIIRITLSFLIVLAYYIYSKYL